MTVCTNYSGISDHCTMSCIKSNVIIQNLYKKPARPGTFLIMSLSVAFVTSCAKVCNFRGDISRSQQIVAIFGFIFAKTSRAVFAL